MHDPVLPIVWWFYLGSSVLLTVFVWWNIRHLRPCWFKAVFMGFGIAILFTPTFGNALGEYWVPAFMAAGFEGLTQGVESSYQYIKPMATVWGIVGAFSLLLCFVFKKKK